MKTAPLLTLTLLCGVVPASAGTSLKFKWAVTPNDPITVDYITTGNTERGMCYNPATGNLILASRTGGNRILVLNSADGDSRHTLSTTGISGGTFLFNHVGAGEDGAIYTANLVLAPAAGAAAAFKIYRWASDAANEPAGTNEPTLVFSGDPSGINELTGASIQPQRWGDTMTVRGGGVNTQLLFGSDGTAASVFTTSDGINFTPHLLAGATEPNSARGIAFGVGDTFYSNANGQDKKIRRSSFDLTTNTATVLQDFTVANNQFVGLAVEPVSGWIGTFEYHSVNQDKAYLFDIGAAASPPVLLGTPPLLLPDPNNVNANAAGSVAIGGGKMFVLNTNNGITAFDIEVTAEIVPPSIATSPATRAVYERGQTTFTVSATGTLPLAYQWNFEGTPIPTATNSSYTINPVTAASAGAYTCTVSNAAPTTATSAPAALTVAASVNTAALTECWHISPGGRTWLTTGDSERGMDYHAPSGRVYIVSRTPSTAIHIVSAADGSDIGSLNMTDVTGGFFSVNQVATDLNGAIYACNLTLDGDGFRIYRWANDDPATVATVIFDGNLPSTRTGDTLDLRTFNGTTQIVAASRAAKSFLIVSHDQTFDVWNGVPYATDAPDGAFGLGLAFGSGNTLWGKNGGGALIRLTFDPESSSGLVSSSFPTTEIPATVGPIGLDPAAGYLVALETGNSDNARLYQVPVPFPDPAPASLALLDQEFLFTDNPNVNGTGAVSVVGDKAFVLSSNNGLTCYTIAAPPVIATPVISDVTRSGDNVVFTLTGTAGATYQIERSTTLTPAPAWSADGTVTLPVAGTSLDVTRPIDAGSPRLFFRARTP